MRKYLQDIDWQSVFYTRLRDRSIMVTDSTEMLVLSRVGLIGQGKYLFLRASWLSSVCIWRRSKLYFHVCGSIHYNSAFRTFIVNLIPYQDIKPTTVNAISNVLRFRLSMPGSLSFLSCISPWVVVVWKSGMYLKSKFVSAPRPCVLFSTITA